MDAPEALRKWRKLHGISQKTVADAIGVSEQTVWRWEGGTGRPDVAHLQILERHWPGLVTALGLTLKPLESGTEARE